MSTKTTGAEWKKFYADDSAWPDGWFHEDEIITINGIKDDDIDLKTIADDSVVVVSGGVVFMGDYGNDGDSLEGHFKKWRKKQTHVFLTVEVHKDNVDKVRSGIESSGGKVLK